jgi:hypothetical protein
VLVVGGRDHFDGIGLTSRIDGHVGGNGWRELMAIAETTHGQVA